DPKKIQAVKDWPIPETVKDVQSFLGFTNFYRRFVEKYSGITAPLSELTKKGVVIAKGGIKGEPLEAFETLKLRFTTAPILQMHDPTRPQRVDADASDFALACILMQQGEDGKWRPVFYHSRKFSSAEL